MRSDSAVRGSTLGQLLFVVCLVPALAHAWFSSGDAGTRAFPLLRVGIGARAVAMGEAFTGLANDVSALYWNPAGLCQLKRLELLASHQEWFLDTRDEVLALAHCHGRWAWGGAAAFSTVSGIEFYDEDKRFLDTSWTNAGYLSLSAGYALDHKLAFGISAKGLYDNLRAVQGWGACVDLGMSLRPSRVLGLGLNIYNLGYALFYQQAKYPLPTGLRAGLACNWRDLSLTSDLDLAADHSPDLRLGTEYRFPRFLALRAGYRLGLAEVKDLGGLSGLRVGCGLAWQNLALDYAFAPYGRLGATHRIEFRLAAYPPAPTSVRITVTDVLTQLPLEAQITATGASRTTAICDAKGHCTITKLRLGWLKVQAEFENYVPRLDSIKIDGPGEKQLTIALAPIGEGSVWGMVLEDSTRKPVGGIVRYAGAVSGYLYADSLSGSYLTKKLPCGEYQFTVQDFHDHYIPQCCTLLLRPGDLTTQDFLLRRRQ